MDVAYKQCVCAPISHPKFRHLLRLSALDLIALQIAASTHLNRNTVNRYLSLLRQVIARHCEQSRPSAARLNFMKATSVLVACAVSAGVPFGANNFGRSFQPANLRGLSNQFLRVHFTQIYAPHRRRFVVGAVLRLYNDFPDPHPTAHGHPSEQNYVNKGVMTEDRGRECAFETVQQIFRDLR